MSIPEFSLRQLIECGVHFGHQSHRWNPLMGEYIHSKRNGIHIIDLTKTVPMLDAALNAVFSVVSKGGSILLVGTKRQAQKPIADAAERSAQFYINQRWLGGTLTNWNTVSNSINRLNQIDQRIKDGIEGLTKKEMLGLQREQAKLQASLGGIRDMQKLPDMLFVVDVKKEALAVAEAKKLGIPVVAIVDTNCSPDGVTHLVPGNDDASRAINFYCDMVARAAIAGLRKETSQSGEDIGELAEGELLAAGSTDDSGTADAGQASKAADDKPEAKADGDGGDKPSGEAAADKPEAKADGGDDGVGPEAADTGTSEETPDQPAAADTSTSEEAPDQPGAATDRPEAKTGADDADEPSDEAAASDDATTNAPEAAADEGDGGEPTDEAGEGGAGKEAPAKDAATTG